MLLSKRDLLSLFSRMFEYYEDEEFELFQYGNISDSDQEDDCLHPEDWQDVFSEDLLNVWMSIVEYHEYWYLPLTKTFNQLCEYIYSTQDSVNEKITSEIQAIKDHKFVKNRDWEYFFSK